jgi:hypothetical protein
MQTIDRVRAAMARKIVREAFHTELDPLTDVSALTSNPINQAMYAQRMNRAGGNVAFGTAYRWTHVDPADIAQCKLFGHFYGLAYKHLAVATAFDTAEGESIASLIRQESVIPGDLQ